MFLLLLLLGIALGKEYYYNCQHAKEVNAAHIFLQVLYDTGNLTLADNGRKFMLEFGEQFSHIYTCKIMSLVPFRT